jgi:amidase
MKLLTGQTPCSLAAHVQAQAVAQREISALELLEATLAHIRERNPALHAVVSLDEAAARAQARAADAALARGARLGPLHGVPLTLKDGIDVAGLRTTLGTPVFDRLADQDATVAARLRAAGAILMGHSNVAPFLADYQSHNSLFGRTANPWNLARTAGGSSGGAAAAVATGMSALEVVSDLGGSARLPAHFCGVYGLKPSENRVPLTGFFRLPPEVPRGVRILACLGPMARNLDDLELALSLIAGPDGFDTEVPPVPWRASDASAPAAWELSRLRVAYALELPGAPVAKALQEAVQRTVSGSARAGGKVTSGLPACDWAAGNALFGELVGEITSSEPKRSLAWYLGALHRRDGFISIWERFFQDHDVLIIPPAMTSAFAHCEPGTPLQVDGQARPYFGQGALLAMANMAGLPALVVPAGRDDEGLPVGVQLIGRRWSEESLIAAARALELAGVLPGFSPPPLPSP